VVAASGVIACRGVGFRSPLSLSRSPVLPLLLRLVLALLSTKLCIASSPLDIRSCSRPCSRSFSTSPGLFPPIPPDELPHFVALRECLPRRAPWIRRTYWAVSGRVSQHFAWSY
jgi:hypothetical protein